jgi:hypothetical protein
VMAIGHHKRVIKPYLASIEIDLPQAVGHLPGMRNRRVEQDPVSETEMIDIGFEIQRDLRMVRKIGIVCLASENPRRPSCRARC